METNGSGQRYGWDDERLVEAMLGFGFSTCAYDPFARRIKRAPTGTANTIFVRDIAAVQKRVAQAPRFQLVNGEI